MTAAAAEAAKAAEQAAAAAARVAAAGAMREAADAAEQEEFKRKALRLKVCHVGWAGQVRVVVVLVICYSAVVHPHTSKEGAFGLPQKAVPSCRPP